MSRVQHRLTRPSHAVAPHLMERAGVEVVVWLLHGARRELVRFDLHVDPASRMQEAHHCYYGSKTPAAALSGGGGQVPDSQSLCPYPFL